MTSTENTENTQKRVLILSAIVLVLIGLVVFRYWDYLLNPWTRNGQVMAQVIQITPRVSGTLVELPIIDNQFVKAGDPRRDLDHLRHDLTVAGPGI